MRDLAHFLIPLSLFLICTSGFSTLQTKVAITERDGVKYLYKKVASNQGNVTV